MKKRRKNNNQGACCRLDYCWAAKRLTRGRERREPHPLRPCLGLMAARRDRWPPYLWSREAQYPHATNCLLKDPQNPQEMSHLGVLLPCPRMSQRRETSVNKLLKALRLGKLEGRSELAQVSPEVIKLLRSPNVPVSLNRIDKGGAGHAGEHRYSAGKVQRIDVLRKGYDFTEMEV
ncbi:hypothetical protein DPEC_G00304520 [Dallia pectoralis]|uniref:Uncharacterized protein n=1 Tax=Dallia pectoralis TaxID=75939 RepID=A0ACC2FDJ7_DALPE|nr:hypothetical protein DPEC_G00304520 [Dallia pectoralis]